MDGFDDILTAATAGIGQAYFLLNVHGGDAVYAIGPSPANRSGSQVR
jgi:hypothetical protein